MHSIECGLRKIAAVLLCASFLSAQTKKVLLLNGSPTQVSDFQSVSSKVRIVPVTSASVNAEIADADGFIGVLTPQMFANAKSLKWVGVMSAGVENVLFRPGTEAFRASNVTLTNNKEVQGPEIADHAFALLLYTSRGLNVFAKNKEQELWQPRPYGGIELRGKTALVIGVGGIGNQIALRA